MPRQACLDAPGTVHHVIVRGIEKRRIVDDQKDRENFISRLGELASDTGTSIYKGAVIGGQSRHQTKEYPLIDKITISTARSMASA